MPTVTKSSWKITNSSVEIETMDGYLRQMGCVLSARLVSMTRKLLESRCWKQWLVYKTNSSNQD